MAGLMDVAKDAGCKEVKCEHCGKTTEMGDVLRALFQAILDRMTQDEKVHIPGFGVFQRTLWKGRNLKVPFKDKEGFFSSDRWVLRFRSSSVAKKFLNKEEE